MESIKPRLRMELCMCAELIITSYRPSITIDYAKSVMENINFSKEKIETDRLVDIRHHDGIHQTTTQNGALHVH
jgi:hypothetical protein